MVQKEKAKNTILTSHLVSFVLESLNEGYTSKEYEDFRILVGPPRTLSFQNASNLSWAGDNVIQVCAKSNSL